MYILGINGGTRIGYQDVSAVVLKDGEIIAAVEEERLNRIKHSPGRISYLSVIEVLRLANISIKDIDAVGCHGSTWGDQFQQVLIDFFNHNFGYCPPVYRVHHHLAHAASTFYASGFEEAMILTMDASGDGIALQKAVGKGVDITIKEQIPRTNSIGIFYAMMTQFCGFIRDSDEYKLMGLAPYGNGEQYDLSKVVEVNQQGYQFNHDFMVKLAPNAPQPTKQFPIFSQKLIDLLGEPRVAKSPMDQKYIDIAAATQNRLNEAVIAVVKNFHHSTGLRKLCLAGGVALNCATNAKLKELDFIDAIYVQPASGDSGISLGAAYLVAAQLGGRPKPMKNAYLGGAFTNDEIKEVLTLTGANFREIEHVSETAADLVAQNKVIGWFQGKMEYGPRALGNRSILGNPLHPTMKEIINAKIKFRESFRPFCPSVLEEDFKTHFKGKFDQAPYMTINYDVVNNQQLPSITHVDHTARVQTVNSEQNQLYYHYLSELKEKIGVGISINTSFNRNNEPIVNSPIDALSAFYGSGMDALIIGNYLIVKEGM